MDKLNSKISIINKEDYSIKGFTCRLAHFTPEYVNGWLKIKIESGISSSWKCITFELVLPWSSCSAPDFKGWRVLNDVFDYSEAHLECFLSSSIKGDGSQFEAKLKERVVDSLSSIFSEETIKEVVHIIFSEG